MKLYLFLFIFLGFTSGAFAQDPVTIESLSKKVCECIEIKISENPAVYATEVMETCISLVFTENEESLYQTYDEDFLNNPENARNLGIDIGKKLLKNCEALMNHFIEQEKEGYNDSDKAFKQGETEKANGNFKEALEFFSRAVSLDTDNAEYVNTRGTVHFLLGDYYRAISDFLRAIELNNQVGIYYYNIANSLHELSDLEESLKYLETSLELDETNCNALNLKGLIYEFYENSDSSIYYFERAFECDATDPIIAYNTAFAYYNKQEYTIALNWFETSDSLGYSENGLYSYIGNCYYGLAEYKKAIEYHQIHFSRDTANYIPVYNIGTCHYQLADFDKASEYLKKAYVLEEDDSDIPLYLARSYSGKRDNLTAKAFIDKAIELNPSSAELYDERAKIYVYLEDYEKAISDYGMSLALYPDDCNIYQLLGEAYKKTGKIREADQAFARSVELGCK